MQLRSLFDLFSSAVGMVKPKPKNMPKVAVLTFTRSAELCIDRQYLEHLFVKEGFIYEEVIWDTPNVNWKQYEAALIRSTCDYFDGKYDLFIETLRHIEQLGIPLLNPLSIVQWNSKKTYLADLKNKGINVIETIFTTPSSVKHIASAMKGNDWEKCVIKPSVSAAAHKTFCLSLQEAESFDLLAHFASDEPILIQPFAPEIVNEGEWSFIFFDKKFSHAMLSTPKTGDFRVQFFHGGHLKKANPESWMIEEAERILKASGFENILYVRVDAIRRGDKLFVMELEMIEPYLYFDYYPETAQTFVKTFKRYYQAFTRSSGSLQIVD